MYFPYRLQLESPVGPQSRDPGVPRPRVLLTLARILHYLLFPISNLPFRIVVMDPYTRV